jgi:hypothetical protein
MRLNSKKQRDHAGFSVELICRTIMSHSPDGEWNSEWNDALRYLQAAQEILERTGFYSDEYDSTAAAY